MMIKIIVTVILLFPSILWAATGDILSTSLLTDNPGASGDRTIVTGTGCVGDTGTCVKMDCTDGTCSGTDGWELNIADSPEVTIEWYEKYDVWPLAQGTGGCKSIRPYSGSGTGDYMAAFISSYGGNDIYFSTWDSAKVNDTEYTTDFWETPPHSDGCTTSDYVTYTCAQGTGFGKLKVTLSEGMGTNWRKMRLYIKMPASRSSGDGEFILWRDDVQLLRMYDIDMADVGVEPPATTRVLFAPVDGSATPHGHWYDNITIYEGYVPPEGATPTCSDGIMNGTETGIDCGGGCAACPSGAYTPIGAGTTAISTSGTTAITP